MKADIHPTYFPQAKLICNCGRTSTVGSTLEEIRVEVCSNCHPYYTGKQNLIDTAGRVDKFSARRQRAAELKTEQKAKKAATKKQEKSAQEVLKELRTKVSK